MTFQIGRFVFTMTKVDTKVSRWTFITIEHIRKVT